jgi:hypothetical protein
MGASRERAAFFNATLLVVTRIGGAPETPAGRQADGKFTLSSRFAIYSRQNGSYSNLNWTGRRHVVIVSGQILHATYLQCVLFAEVYDAFNSVLDNYSTLCFDDYTALFHTLYKPPGQRIMGKYWFTLALAFIASRLSPGCALIELSLQRFPISNQKVLPKHFPSRCSRGGKPLACRDAFDDKKSCDRNGSQLTDGKPQVARPLKFVKVPLRLDKRSNNVAVRSIERQVNVSVRLAGRRIRRSPEARGWMAAFLSEFATLLSFGLLTMAAPQQSLDPKAVDTLRVAVISAFNNATAYIFEGPTTKTVEGPGALVDFLLRNALVPAVLHRIVTAVAEALVEDAKNAEDNVISSAANLFSQGQEIMAHLLDSLHH